MKWESKGLSVCILICLLVSLLFPLAVGADANTDILPIVQSAKAYYVRDDANVLSDQTESHVVKYGKELYEKTGSQIVVVTMDFTGSIPISEYAHQILEQWNVSGGEEGNGVVLLMSIGAREYYVLSGKGLTKYLSAGTLGELADRYMEPNFSQGQYDQGARELFDALKERINLVYSDENLIQEGLDSTEGKTAEAVEATENSGAVRNEQERTKKEEMNPTLGAVVVVLALILFFRYRGNSKGKRKK